MTQPFWPYHDNDDNKRNCQAGTQELGWIWL